MKIFRIPVAMTLLLFVAACVTINVYFPSEAAAQAADRIIQDVYGEQPGQTGAPVEPQSRLRYEELRSSGHVLLDWFISPVHAEADISVNTPAIRQLQDSMEERHKQLAPYYKSGAVGMTRDGEITLRDQKLVPMQDRNSVKGLVSKENRDRSALYKEIAKANGHPEWEAEIRNTFAKRWVSNAPAGWWYQSKQGAWKQK
ncbi:MAG: YdbL family protein [Gammaproteobacteria bacterium]|nr:YdbL family protein [Gammaproteobacteria bacterium]